MNEEMGHSLVVEAEAREVETSWSRSGQKFWLSNGTWLTKCGGGYLESGSGFKSTSHRETEVRAARMGQMATCPAAVQMLEQIAPSGACGPARTQGRGRKEGVRECERGGVGVREGRLALRVAETE